MEFGGVGRGCPLLGTLAAEATVKLSRPGAPGMAIDAVRPVKATELNGLAAMMNLISL